MLSQPRKMRLGSLSLRWKAVSFLFFNIFGPIPRFTPGSPGWSRFILTQDNELIKVMAFNGYITMSRIQLTSYVVTNTIN
jgi:hypothetical protein